MFDILSMDDFYSLGDYEESNNIDTCLVPNLKNSNINGENYIRITYNIGNQSKEIAAKNQLQKEFIPLFKLFITI